MSQFTDRKFLEFCDKHHIRVDWAVVAHPQTNNQVERANGTILQGLKPRIFDRLNKSGRKWLQELPVAVSSLRTTRAEPRDLPPSSWSTTWRLSSARTCNTDRPMSKTMTKAPTSEPARTHWINWTRHTPWP
jgi:hypothetical protein